MRPIFWPTLKLPAQFRRPSRRIPAAFIYAGIVLISPSLAGFSGPAQAAEKTTRPGPIVLDIRLQCDAHLILRDFADQIVQKVGEPLDQDKITASIKNLYATGRFQELGANAEPKAGGVVVIFVARAQYFVGGVSVEGAPASFNPGSLASASRLRLGQPLAESNLADAELHLKATLAEDGYYDAEIKHAIQSDADTQEALVVFTIVPRSPAVLGAIEFQGHPVFPPARLIAVARLRPGRRLTSDRLERGLLRIHQFYLKNDRLQAYANVQTRDYDRAHHTEKLILEVEAGPVVKIRVKGARISLSKMKELLPMYSQGVTDVFAVQQGERNLEDHFQRTGYFSVHVAGARQAHAANSEIDITYNVTLGPDGEFAGYEFNGNRAAADEDLEAIMSIQAEDFPFVWRGTFSKVLMAQDVDALTAFYQGRGYLDVKVKPRLDEHHGDRPNHWFVSFDITEGPLTRVGELKLDGVGDKLRKDLLALLTARPGQPYSPARVQSDRDSILGYLGDHGYRQVSISLKESPPSPDHLVNLEYEIHPGPQENIRRVIVMGNKHTRQGVVDREIKFHPGDPVGQTSVVETQRALYDLGIFSQVQIAPQDPQSPETQKTMLVNLEEGRRWTLGYGAGVEAQRLGSNQPQGQFQASPRGSLDVTRYDVGGRDQTFSIRGRLSNLESSAAIGYLIPRLLNRPDLSLRLEGLYDHSRDVATFSAESDEASVSVEKHFKTALLLGRYTFRHVLLDQSTLRISPEEIPLLSRPVRIGSVGGSYINDHRDNPVDATRGSYSLLDAAISTTKFGSQANFIRFSGQNSTYYPLGRHLTFARNTRIGIESPIGGLQKIVIPATSTAPQQIFFTHDIPLPERFFMGGSESDRGFSINQAGPRDPVTGFPVGGNALFLNSFELRLRTEENRLGFAVFHDAGNVYSTARKMRLLKVTQNSPTDLDYTSHAVGVGVRYVTPLGPLRFDVGYNLNPPRFQVQGPAGLGVSQLSHVQFFLGIGQAF